MGLLSILQYPDPRLHTVAARVSRVDDKIRKIINDMAKTMYAAPGIGLAATQVDVHLRIIVIDISSTHDQLKVFVNPEISAASGQSDLEEGCLSVPGVYDKVARAEKIIVRALDAEGQPFTLEADGLLAVCIQHEMDHLVGKLFVDYLSPLKRELVRKKLEKAHKATA